MACGFVYVDGLDLPAVNGVVLTPAYITDAQRTLSGTLRVEHTATPKEWTVTLTGVSGADLPLLLSHLALPAPRETIVMGTATTSMVTVDRVTYRPKLDQPQDLGRADVTLTIREMLATTPPMPPEGAPSADSTTVTADNAIITADAA